MNKLGTFLISLLSPDYPKISLKALIMKEVSKNSRYHRERVYQELEIQKRI
jgi:hypothetical protein